MRRFFCGLAWLNAKFWLMWKMAWLDSNQNRKFNRLLKAEFNIFRIFCLIFLSKGKAWGNCPGESSGGKFQRKSLAKRSGGRSRGKFRRKSLGKGLREKSGGRSRGRSREGPGEAPRAGEDLGIFTPPNFAINVTNRIRKVNVRLYSNNINIRRLSKLASSQCASAQLYVYLAFWSNREFGHELLMLVKAGWLYKPMGRLLIIKTVLGRISDFQSP